MLKGWGLIVDFDEELKLSVPGRLKGWGLIVDFDEELKLSVPGSFLNVHRDARKFPGCQTPSHPKPETLK